jgi:hypothetical protein
VVGKPFGNVLAKDGTEVFPKLVCFCGGEPNVVPVDPEPKDDNEVPNEVPNGFTVLFVVVFEDPVVLEEPNGVYTPNVVGCENV